MLVATCLNEKWMVGGDAGETRMIMMVAISHGVCKCVFFWYVERAQKIRKRVKTGIDCRAYAPLGIAIIIFLVCLVIWHRLVSALHLNGSLGEVRDLHKDSTGHTFVSSLAMVNGGEPLSRI